MNLFTLINGESVAFSGDEKVIPQKAFSKILSAEKILEEAELQREQFEIALEEERKQALERGYRDGFAQGLQEFAEHVIALDESQKSLRIELQSKILPLALKAAKKIVGEALALSPELIVGIVEQTIKTVRDAHSVKIGVSKDDKALLEKEKSNLKKMLDRVETFVIEERVDVAPGGCIIETEKGIINATLENQWRALEAAFERLAKQ